MCSFLIFKSIYLSLYTFNNMQLIVSTHSKQGSFMTTRSVSYLRDSKEILSQLFTLINPPNKKHQLDHPWAPV